MDHTIEPLPKIILRVARMGAFLNRPAVVGATFHSADKQAIAELVCIAFMLHLLPVHATEFCKATITIEEQVLIIFVMSAGRCVNIKTDICIITW